MLWLDSLWHFIWSSASIATLLGVAALAVAILEPKFMDAITDLRKWAIMVAVIAFSYNFIAGKFYHDGLSVKQAQWDSANKKTDAKAVKARTDAELSVNGSDAGGVRDDGYDRDGH